MTSSASTAVSSSTAQTNQTQSTIVNNHVESQEVHRANSINTGDAPGQTPVGQDYSASRWKDERPEEEPWNELTYNAKKEQGKG